MAEYRRVKPNLDKPHRCPICHRVSDEARAACMRYPDPTLMSFEALNHKLQERGNDPAYVALVREQWENVTAYPPKSMEERNETRRLIRLKLHSFWREKEMPFSWWTVQWLTCPDCEVRWLRRLYLTNEWYRFRRWVRFLPTDIYWHIKYWRARR